MTNARSAGLLLCSVLVACGGAESAFDDDTAASDLSSGGNGSKCAQSPYNCALDATGNSRVPTNDPNDQDYWTVTKGETIRDGNGDALAVSKDTQLLFNYGQVRTFGGKAHAFATSTSNHSSGWFPIDAIAGSASFMQKVGHVSAHSTGEANLGCYQILDSDDETLAAKKVVYDPLDKDPATGKLVPANNMRAGDYLPLLRNNGKRSANLAYVVPGFGLGGTAVDHFPAGTKFQRISVPTKDGAPSLTIPLYSIASNGHYTVPAGTMKFIYGYITANTGTPRYGWMAYDALKVSGGCVAP